MAKSVWTTLTTAERDELVRQRYEEDADMSEMAEKLDMFQPTLERRLREWRKLRQGNPDAAPLEGKEEQSDNSESFTINKKGNQMEVTGPPGQIVTLDELLAATQVDLDVWAVERYIVNKWPISRKRTLKDLQWNSGTLDGYVQDQGDFTTIDHFQVKAWLVRKQPIPLFPIVQPVEINISPRDYKEKPVPGSNLKTTLVIPDMHIGFYRDFMDGSLTPFHDRGAMSIALQVAQDTPFDHIIFLGDNLDLPDWSDKFIRSPDFRNVTQPAIDESAWWHAQFRIAAPQADIDEIEGNHEHRMVKARQTNMIAAFDVRPASQVDYPPALSIPSLVELDKMHIRWVDGYPEGEVWVSKELVCVHGDRARSGAGDSAKAMLQIYDTSVLFGHIHRKEYVVRTRKASGGMQTTRAVCPGCLCKTDGTVPGHTTAQNWTQGFAVVYSDSSGDHIENVEIECGRAVFQGKVYKAYDPTPDIKKDLGVWKGL